MIPRGGTGAVLRRLLRYGRPHVAVLGKAFLAMAALGLSTGAFAFLTGPALRVLLTGGAQGWSGGTRLLHFVGGQRSRPGPWAIPEAVAVLAAVKGCAYLGQFYWTGLFGQRIVGDLRRDFFAKLAALSPVQLSLQLSGDLLSRFASDMAAVELAAVYAVASYLRDSLQVLILLGWALFLNWKLTLLTLGVAPLAAIPVSLLTGKVLRRTREAQGRLGALAGQLKEGLGGVRTIQAFGSYEAERSRFDAQTQGHRSALVKAAWARGAVPGVTEVLAAAAIAGVLCFVASRRDVAPEQLVSFLVTLVLLYQPAKDLGRAAQFAQQAAAAGERLFEVLDWQHPVEDARGALQAPSVTRAVALEDVHFAYGDRAALAGLSLEMPVGKVTALVGPSGAGKSTVTAVLERFVRPQRGELLLDGVPADRYGASSVRRQFALVTQEPLLFAQTVRENLRFARPSATDEEVVAAARAAHADAFIQALPQGYETQLGERGLRLSGGQRQRLCLARALVMQAPILVLDEATSSLDPQSEREVQLALSQVLRGRTALVIAHRLSSIVHADQIHVMDAGRIVESGSHAELLARAGTYARLWALQERPALAAEAS